ncbi:RPM1 interacting protein 13-like [Pyrus communis]|uniref:RPM1 interacting protein 13-like n=1 Tax=Pyrus communis TaxID=23211 RepID=UPI0035BEC3E7
MNLGPIYISSDDELGRIELDEEDNLDWVSELLEPVDKVTDDDDSDDVVVISEVNSKPRQKSSKRTVADDDDDCLVLDGNPDKRVSVVENSGSGSDELLVVGETGQVACRDYPHPRHLCAKFPFKTTQHENHCDRCHCYVCDSLAPCVHWSTGGSNFNHCHATDKEESWRILRKKFKTPKIAPLPASNNLAPTKHSPVPPHNIIKLAPNSISQNQVSRPAAIHHCTSAGRTMPSIRSHQSEYLFPKNQVQPCSVSKQLLGARTNVVGRNRGQNIGHLGPVSSHSTFKRVGALGVSLPMNRTTFFSSNNSSCTTPSVYMRTSTPMATSNDRNPLRLQGVHSSVHQSASQPMTTSVGNTVHSQPQTYSQAVPQSIYSQAFQQQGNQSQNDSQIFCEYGIPSPDSSQGGYQYGNQSQNSSQNVSLQGNLGVSVTDLDFTNSDWVNNSSPNIRQPPVQQPPFQQPPIRQPSIQLLPVQQPPIQQQPPLQQPQFQQPSPIQQQPPIDISEIQSTEPVYGLGAVNERSNEVSNFNGLDEEFESWLMETQSGPAESNDLMASHLNIMSPEPSFIDSLIFDFEPPWNGLAQV